MSPGQSAVAVEVERSNPFPGLRTFEPDEDYLFFGREEQIDELLRRLRTTRFLSILGSSGSGKSSLVRAGLIPSLYGGAMTRAGSSWRVAIMRPGEDPIGNLAAALAAPEALGHEGDDAELTRSFLDTTLRASNLGLVECIRQARIPARGNVLVLVDQFEEIFRFKSGSRQAGRDEAMAFVKLLLEGARHPEVPCYVALTMRADFIGNCMEFGELPETINAGLYLVARMTRDELRSAITGPVAVGGGTIAPRLVSRLLNDVGDDPDQLPILQHALLRTWTCWEEDHAPSEPLDLRHYEAIGTMREALSRHAEEAYGELDTAGQRVAEKMFKALCDKGTDERGIRRPAPVGEICAVSGASRDEVAAVVESFRRPGRSFLMPPAGVPLEESSILDLSHESLMRIWGRLAGWVVEEARSAQLYLGAARAATRYAEGRTALWRDPELQLALTWRDKEHPTAAWARRYDPGFENAMAFLDASKAERDQEVQERDRRRRRELRRARVLAVVLGSASVVMLVLGAKYFLQQREAETALMEATTQEEIAKRERTVADAQRQEAQRQARVAQEERANAENESRRADEQRQIAEAERKSAESNALRARAKSAEAEAARLDAQSQREKAVEQRALAERLRGEAETSAQEARRLGLLSAARALALQIQRPHQDEAPELPALLALQVYRLLRDNQGHAGDPDVFDALRAALGRLRPDTVLRGNADGIRALAVAPDGETLVSGAEDGRLLRFALNERGNPPAVLGSFPSGVRSVALAGDGNLLAAGSADGLLRIWDLRHPDAPPRELGTAPAGGAVGALAFQPGGSLLAAGSGDGSVRLWDRDRAASPAATLAGGDKRVAAVAWSADGRTLAAGLAQGGGALLWQATEPAAAPRTACAGLDVRSVALSPDGKLFACGAGRGQILLTQLEAPGAAPVTLLGHASSVNSLSFSPRGDSLASAGSDGKVRLWDLHHLGAQPVVLNGHKSWVWAVAFTGGGDQLVSASEDQTLRLWPARPEGMARELCEVVHRGLTEEEWSRSMPADLAYSGESPCPVSR